MSLKEKLTAIADALRRFNTGALWQKKMNLDEMVIAVEDVYLSGETLFPTY